MKIYVYILLTLISCSVYSQQGPIIECSDCDNNTQKSIPVSGNWYNPQQSGSGYIIDVQKGILSVLYLGYGSDGEPTWFSFAGELQASEEPNVNWTVEGALWGYTGGNAFNQDYQAPQADTTTNRIKIDFHYSHYASIQINEGAVQKIVPINYTVPASQDFEETDQVFPQLTGNWSFVISKQAPSNDLNNYDGRSFYMEAKEVTISEDGTKTVKYQFSHSSSKPSVVTPVVNTVFENEGLVCSNPPDSNTGIRQVKCWIEDFPTKGETMQVAPGDIGPDYIFGQNQSGDTFEAFRFDYLPSL